MSHSNRRRGGRTTIIAIIIIIIITIAVINWSKLSVLHVNRRIGHVHNFLFFFFSASHFSAAFCALSGYDYATRIEIAARAFVSYTLTRRQRLLLHERLEAAAAARTICALKSSVWSAKAAVLCRIAEKLCRFADSWRRCYWYFYDWRRCRRIIHLLAIAWAHARSIKRARACAHIRNILLINFAKCWQ